MLDFVASLDGIYLSSLVSVDDQQMDSIVRYSVATPPESVVAMAQNQTSLEYEILSLSAENSSGQSLELSEGGWQIQFAEGNHLDGSVEYEVSGGDFDYLGISVYADSSYAEASYRCR